jgi:putative ABC transport system permease protein
LYDAKVMSDRVYATLGPRSLALTLAAVFGSAALLLAAVGIYGVLAYQVRQRTREIAIRMALGSDALGILRLILREGALLVVVGLAVGLAGALALRGLIASQLYGVGALDPGVLLAVTGILAIASLAACLGPARRASRVSPVVALAEP